MPIDPKAGGGIMSRCLAENQPHQRSTPQPSKFKPAGSREIFNEDQIQRRSVAHDSGVTPRARRAAGGANQDVGR